MLALGLIFARPLLELLNTRDDLIDGAELYLRIYFLGMPPPRSITTATAF